MIADEHREGDDETEALIIRFLLEGFSTREIRSFTNVRLETIERIAAERARLERTLGAGP